MLLLVCQHVSTNISFHKLHCAHHRHGTTTQEFHLFHTFSIFFRITVWTTCARWPEISQHARRSLSSCFGYASWSGEPPQERKLGKIQRGPKRTNRTWTNRSHLIYTDGRIQEPVASSILKLEKVLKRLEHVQNISKQPEVTVDALVILVSFGQNVDQELSWSASPRLATSIAKLKENLMQRHKQRTSLVQHNAAARNRDWKRADSKVICISLHIIAANDKMQE